MDAPTRISGTKLPWSTRADGREADGKGKQDIEYVADPAGRLISSLYLSNPTTQASDSRYFQYDGLGSVIGRTNQQGNAVSNYSYEAFGAITSKSGQDSNAYTYMGQAYDTSTGLYYFNARWYDASIGRFISADPLPGNPFQSGSTNRYAYALDNPIAYEDVSGMAARAIFDAYMQGWTNFGTAWSIFTNSNASNIEKAVAFLYMWAWGGAHIALAIGSALLLYEAIIYIGALLATQNPDGVMVSIGNFSKGATGYIQTGIEKGYTYFTLGRFYGVLDSLGLANPINQRFMQNQIIQGKDFVTTIIDKAGLGTEMEMEMLLQNGYIKIASVWTGFSSIFMHPAIP